MIYTNREQVAAPDILTGPKGPGARETERAKKHFSMSRADTRKRRRRFEFKVYRERAVKQSLERLFHGKCAYCESRYRGTQPMDVEHWRPKGAIDEDGAPKHGYYWLAADWENLFPSCIDCNRQRYQVTAQSHDEVPAGKGSRFPLAPGSRHARGPGGEAAEIPLLLNPCKDRPEEHLAFLKVSEGVVRARRGPTGELSVKARVSIEVYGLNRIALVLDRKEVLLLILQRMATIRRLLVLIADGPLESRESYLAEDVLVYELEVLHGFQRADRPFALMARQVIEPFIAGITGS